MLLEASKGRIEDARVETDIIGGTILTALKCHQLAKRTFSVKLWATAVSEGGFKGLVVASYVAEVRILGEESCSELVMGFLFKPIALIVRIWSELVMGFFS